MAPKNKLNTPENTKTVSLDGTIGWWEADARWLKKQLNGAQNVIFKVNSGGGSVMDANEMYNVLREHPYNVRVEIGALAASAAGYLALAGDEVAVHKNSTWMAHRVSGFAFGTADDMLAEAELTQGLENIIATTISDATGKDLADVKSDMMATKWLFGGQEVMDYGIANEIIDATDDESDEVVIDEATNKLEAKRVLENTLQKFAESPENLRQHGVNFSNFLKEQKNEVSQDEPVTPSNGVLTMPDENQQSTVDARNEGMETERTRTKAWLTFNDVDPEYVAKGIESGKEMNAADIAHFNRKNMDKTAEESLTNSKPADVTPEEVEIPEAVESNEMDTASKNWLAKYQKDGE